MCGYETLLRHTISYSMYVILKLWINTSCFVAAIFFVLTLSEPRPGSTVCAILVSIMSKMWKIEQVKKACFFTLSLKI